MSKESRRRGRWPGAAREHWLFLAATQIGGIDNVIVQEGRGVNEFNEVASSMACRFQRQGCTLWRRGGQAWGEGVFHHLQ